MKKIFYILLTIILAVTVSSYTIPSTIDKNVKTGDSINVSINVHQTKIPVPKSDDLYDKLLKALDSNIEVNESKKLLIDKILQEDQQKSTTSLDQLCIERGYDKSNVLKWANRDVNIRFISSLLVILFTVFIIIYFIQKSIRDKLDYKFVIIFSIIIFLGLYYINGQIQYILSYLFNHNYLTVKELIKFF